MDHYELERVFKVPSGGELTAKATGDEVCFNCRRLVEKGIVHIQLLLHDPARVYSHPRIRPLSPRGTVSKTDLRWVICRHHWHINSNGCRETTLPHSRQVSESLGGGVRYPTDGEVFDEDQPVCTGVGQFAACRRVR